jgi:hypothetical protein
MREEEGVEGVDLGGGGGREEETGEDVDIGAQERRRRGLGRRAGREGGVSGGNEHVVCRLITGQIPVGGPTDMRG